jgi:hypothetical protein
LAALRSADHGIEQGKWPDFDFIVVSVDSAFVWTDPKDGYPKVMLIMAWRKHLPIHGEEQEPQERGKSDNDYVARCMPHWSLCEIPPSPRRRNSNTSRS